MTPGWSAGTSSGGFQVFSPSTSRFGPSAVSMSRCFSPAPRDHGGRSDIQQATGGKDVSSTGGLHTGEVAARSGFAIAGPLYTQEIAPLGV